MLDISLLVNPVDCPVLSSFPGAGNVCFGTVEHGMAIDQKKKYCKAAGVMEIHGAETPCKATFPPTHKAVLNEALVDHHDPLVRSWLIRPYLVGKEWHWRGWASDFHDFAWSPAWWIMAASTERLVDKLDCNMPHLRDWNSTNLQRGLWL